MKTLFSGFLFGLILTFSFGPGFWSLLQVSLTRGFKNGMYFLTGFILSDFLLIAISLLTVTTIKISFTKSIYWGIIASIVFITFGIVTFLKNKALKDKTSISETFPRENFINSLLKGFIFNISNPYNFIFWLGIVGMSIGLYGIYSEGFFIFIITLILTTFSFDTLKCYFASKLQNLLKIRYIKVINIVTGLIMIFSGLFILFKSIPVF